MLCYNCVMNDDKKIISLLVDSLNQDIHNIDKVPDIYMSDTLVKRALFEDVKLLKHIPKKLRTDQNISMALLLGASVRDLEEDDINFNTSFMACFSNWENFYLLPPAYQHPINFVGACMNRSDLSSFDIIDDEEYINNVNICFRLFNDLFGIDMLDLMIKKKVK